MRRDSWCESVGGPSCETGFEQVLLRLWPTYFVMSNALATLNAATCDSLSPLCFSSSLAISLPLLFSLDDFSLSSKIRKDGWCIAHNFENPNWKGYAERNSIFFVWKSADLKCRQWIISPGIYEAIRTNREREENVIFMSFFKWSRNFAIHSLTLFRNALCVRAKRVFLFLVVECSNWTPDENIPCWDFSEMQNLAVGDTDEVHFSRRFSISRSNWRPACFAWCPFWSLPGSPCRCPRVSLPVVSCSTTNPEIRFILPSVYSVGSLWMTKWSFSILFLHFLTL